jgi:UDP-N-acetylglucosamine 2-epimerase
VTIERGTNELLPLDPAQVVRRIRAVSTVDPSSDRPPYWDGRTAERIVSVLAGEPRHVVPGAHERANGLSTGRNVGVAAET